MYELHLLARVYENELGLAHSLQVDANVTVSFGRGVAAAPDSLPCRHEALRSTGICCVNQSSGVACVGERHDVTHHELNARGALQVLDSVNATVTRRDVEVVDSIVRHNLTATIQRKRRFLIRVPCR